MPKNESGPTDLVKKVVILFTFLKNNFLRDYIHMNPLRISIFIHLIKTANLKILGLIPARGGSKGIPGKNIKKLKQKPLLQYTYESARASRHLSRIILSSDDQEIIKVGKGIGLEVPFIRPKDLAQDATTSLDVILHALQFFSEKDEKFDAVCLLQPTTPFRRKGLIDEAIKKFSSNNYDALVSVRKVPDDYNPHWVFEDQKGLLRLSTGENSIISRRQDLPETFHRDGALYLTKTTVLLQEQSLYGKRLGYIETTKDPYVNIDVPEDFEEAEKIIERCVP